MITTVAGTTWVFPAGAQPALNAPLGQLTALAIDASGNLYVVDQSNNIVVKITPGGTLTTVAGNGIQGLSGDGGPATGATLQRPYGVALDVAGNLYIADLSARVRRVDAATGVITTFAGGNGFTSAGDGGPATKAGLGGPVSVAVDSAGNVYIGEATGARIRRVDSSGIIRTFAGTGNTGFSGDGGPATSADITYGYYSQLAFDAAGNLYFGDGNRGHIRKITPSGTISTFAGNGVSAYSGNGGPALSASINQAVGIAFDAAGNMYFCDSNNGRIRKIDTAGTITLVAGTGFNDLTGDGGPATAATFSGPYGIAVDASGSLLISDLFNRRVRKIAGGVINTIAGNGLYQGAGDGGPATSASMSGPTGITMDSAGNLIIAETFNNRIRKVDSKGVITTLAGVVLPGFSGDGGPGTNARINNPMAVATDASGNVFWVDTFNSRVRKLNPSGVISTVSTGAFNPSQPFGIALDGAGNLLVADTLNHRIIAISPAGAATVIAGTGTGGFSGDGGSAKAATLNYPTGIAADATGIYFCDESNHRIRKIAADGTISTVAGNGVAGFSGDGGPAASAMLRAPRAIFRDTKGNLYIADTSNHRIRVVNAAGIISTIAGTGAVGPLGDGGSPLKASLAAPQGVFADSAGNVFIADSNNNRIREIPAAAPSFSVSPATLQFSASAGGASQTAQIAVSGSQNGLALTAVITLNASSGTPGGSWLTLSSTTVVVPGFITVTANPSTLSAGTYQGSITLQSALSSSGPQTVAVTLTVAAGTPAQLQVQPSSLGFSLSSNATAPALQTLTVGNSGGGTLSWTATVTGKGISLSAASGSATSTSPSSLQVSASASGLAPGIYSGSVTVKSGTQTTVVPVVVSIVAQTQTILLSQTGLLFVAVEGGTVVPSQTFGIVNTGQGVMSWTVTATTTGGNWLTVTPGSGSSAANSTQIPLVEASVDATGLKAGRYGGLIRIASSAANNSPQIVSVILNVMPPGSNPGVLVRPTGLIFVATQGSQPSSQNIRLASALPGATQYGSGLVTFSGNWAQALPEAGTLSPGSPRNLVVQPDPAGLASGVYRGALTLIFSDGTPAQAVNLLMLVLPAGSNTGAQSLHAPSAACVATQLLGASRTLSSNFSSPTGWPATLEVQVVDDCGVSRTDATVIASFSNGDAPLALTSLGNGLYTGTWRPAAASSQTTVTFRAAAPGLTPAVLAIQGGVGANSAAAVGSGGVVNAASYDKNSVLAPGSIVSVFGSSMTTSSTPATGSTFPLPTTLSGATVLIGGIPSPIFYASGGQINAQVPFELPPNARPQVALQTAALYAVPETITIDAARPGIFTTDGSQGVVLTPGNQLVDAAHPAAAGDVLVVYCTGLGVTNPLVATNQRSPEAIPAVAAIQPTATIGGVNAPVKFAGLTPGFIGLYQVNVQVPAGVMPGPAAPLVLTQAGAVSNTVMMGVK